MLALRTRLIFKEEVKRGKPIRLVIKKRISVIKEREA